MKNMMIKQASNEQFHHPFIDPDCQVTQEGLLRLAGTDIHQTLF
jgi:hypothetical protein